MPSVYQHTFSVQSADLDELNHVNNVVYVKWIQEAAAAHWYRIAPAAVKEKWYWVVLRHEIDYHLPAFLHDKIFVQTWVHDYAGPKSTRVVHLMRQSDHRLLVDAKTVWCLLSVQGNKPVRIGDEIKSIFDAPGLIV